ncbi:XRE family transcriptional regulator [Actinacidiphila bryophytorum]|uniref:XRE family transcriptional regulator n=1 Tax=Actinacidiphila bryophytorum TaxID=1436133 RepID=UPI002176E580|nr:XRE family transcriptional regulator [Actinacidiphila bryophytorum]UWE12066.1 XRE family transcriptional regulator [Actinacidiphila bryophytorum]
MPAEFWKDERLRDALASWHMGRVFYAYRTHPWHSRTVSQEVLAGWLGLTQAQLSRMESAGDPPHDLRKLMSWAHGLGVPADLLWFKLPCDKPVETDAAPAPQSPEQGSSPGSTAVSAGEASITATTTEHDPMSPIDRRSLLKGGVVALAPTGLGPEELQRVAAALEDARRYLDQPVVEHFRRGLDAAKQDDGARGPRTTLPVVLGLLGAIDRHAREVKPRVRRELLSVGADGAEFAGWLYRDLKQPATAVFWYDRAMEWAQEAEDSALQGYVLLKKSQMAYDDRDAVRVLTLAQAAGHDRWLLPRRVRAEVTQQEALGAAMLGEPLGAVRDKLGMAQALLSQAADDAPSSLGAYFTEHTLMLRNAITFTEAGKPGIAVELYDEAMRAGKLSVRDGGFFNARRASALALSGEPDEAAQVGAASAKVAAEMTSQRTLGVLNEALHILERWKNRPAVREFRKAVRAAY